MDLTRRDALAALSAAGVAVGAVAGALRFEDLADALAGDGDPNGGDRGPTLDDRHRETLVALARTLYPAELSGIPEFVETYVAGRIRDRPDLAAGVAEAADRLDGLARDWRDAHFAALPPEERDALLREMGVDGVDPDPDGVVSSRVRYYLVNDLLYALYASPTGGRLVGIENPQGHPGGLDSYRRGSGENEPNGRSERPGWGGDRPGSGDDPDR